MSEPEPSIPVRYIKPLIAACMFTESQKANDALKTAKPWEKNQMFSRGIEQISNECERINAIAQALISAHPELQP